MKNHQRILMYHSIGSSGSSEIGAGLYCVSVERFGEQMKYISAPVLQCSSAPVEVTFDDGYEDNYINAYPILKEFGLKAYFFILAGKVGTAGYMDWKQIRELKDAGMTIGSHGMTHRILTELNDVELDYELKEAKKILEDNLGCVVDYLSIPRGFHNKKIIRKAKEAGYKTVFTSNPSDNDRFVFGRIPVKASWNIGYFQRVLNSGKLSFVDRTKETVKSSTKAMLGASRYDKIRSRMLTSRSLGA